MPRVSYSLVKILENPGVNALLRERLKEPGRLEGYQGITFEQVVQLAAEAGYGPETAALTYQSIKAVAKLPSDRLERLLRRRKTGRVSEGTKQDAYAAPSCQKSTGVVCPRVAGYNVM